MLYFKADMFFVSLSFKDVQFDKFLFTCPPPVQPLVYLQHGVLGIKQLGYKNDYANNCLAKFVYYNPEMLFKLQDINGFKEYQCYNGIAMPRWHEMVKRYENYKNNKNNKKILWFITWREYFSNEDYLYGLIISLTNVIGDDRLSKYLNDNQVILTICLHSLISDKQVKIISDCVKNNNVKIVYASSVDVMDLIVENDLLITDYSSIGFDFTLLGKPVILYQPDIDIYSVKRKFYCDASELEEFNVVSANDLLNDIINENYSVNKFFSSRLNFEITLKKISDEFYLNRMMEYFLSYQKKSITFIGYDFSGVGGTVTATKALSEALCEKGYQVRLVSLRRRLKGMLVPGVRDSISLRDY